MTNPARPLPSSRWRPVATRMATGATLGVASWVLWTALGITLVAGDSIDYGLGASALIGALIGAANWHRALMAIAGAGAAVCLVVAYTPLTSAVAPRFIRRDPPPSRHPDAVVILGAGVNRDGLLDIRALERLLSGLALAPPGDTTPIVTSSVRRAPNSPVTSEPDVRRLVALAGGRNLLLLTGVYSTRDEALAVGDLARHRAWHLITVVTSPSHSRRACATFERAGLTVHCAPSAERSFVLEHLERSPDRIRGFVALVYEAMGSVVYRLRGWT